MIKRFLCYFLVIFYLFLRTFVSVVFQRVRVIEGVSSVVT